MGKFKKFPVILTVFLLLGTLVFAGGPNRRMAFTGEGETTALPYAQGEVLVKFKPGVTVNALNQFAAQNGMIVKKRFALLSKLKGHEYVLVKSSVADTAGMINVLKNNTLVEAVSPNNLNQVAAVPNDTYYAPYMWGLNNTTQTGGTDDADIDAPEAWDINTGSANNIVAVIDTGFDYTHPDLAANAWANAAELAGVTGVDDDGNGYVDDIYGIDPAGTDGFTPDNDPMDGYGHGTHCAGTIGAVGNNSEGIVGVNWNVKIMGLKFFDEAGGNGWDSYAIECIEYILFQKLYRGRNIVAVNASWGSYNYFDQALYDAVAALGDAGIVFCAAAGNDANDNDGDDVHYPSSYDLPNIIAVAATDHDDLIADFSNYGATTVDLGAPGVSIASTIPPYYTAGNGGDVFFDDCSLVGNWVTSGTNNTWAITTEYETYWGGSYPGAPSPPTFWSDSPGIGGAYGYYQHNSNSYLTYNADINLSGYSGTDLYFGMYIGRHISNYDHLYVEISKDSGATWSVLYDWERTGGYVYYWAASSWLIPEDFKTANFRVQFHFVSDASSRGLGVVIDNVGIGGLNTYYELWNGTSMACPHVAGAVALMAAEFPSESVANRIKRILSTVDHNTSLEGLCTTEGRLNLYNAITYDPGTTTIKVVSPNGGEEWTIGSVHNITWTSTGAFDNVDIEYSVNNGANWGPVATGTANDGSYAWTVPVPASTACLVRISDSADDDPIDSSDAVFTILAAGTETISAPEEPLGPSTGISGSSYDFSTKGSESSMGVGHLLQYKFDWNDGSDSGWINAGVINTPASHSWAAPGTYNVRAMARCAQHTDIESPWSAVHPIIISDSSSGYYNSPASLKILPEVIWALASGGGTWLSDVQIVDISGGSQVQVYYNTAAGRRGPFLLWNNSGGSAMSTAKFANLLQTIDELDIGEFTYFGTVGAVEFATQDGSHLVHVAAREVNGNYAKTFPGLNLANENTAGVGRNMIIPNLANNATYRATCGLFNPTADAVTLDLKLITASGAQVGSTVSKTLAGFGFMAFNPFTEAGVPYPGSTYDNIVLQVEPTSGSGAVMCFGATANNTSNDPAAHIAVQQSGYDNGPSSYKAMPEVIWALASGGGTWISDVQIVDVSGGSQVQVYYNTAAGRRGPFLLWDNGAGSAMTTAKFANLLQTIDGLDADAFTYYGTVGAVEFTTQDGSHLIQAAVREANGNYAKTFPGLSLANAETAGVGRSMIIPNLASNATYRATCGFYNPTANAVTIELKLRSASGAQEGTTVNRTLAAYEFMAFNPFAEAGVPYPGSSYDNIVLEVTPTSGSGSVMCFGATANNTSNDPAAHIAVQAQ